MVNTKALVRRARESEDGESCTPVGRGPGFRVGVGARATPGKDPTVFVEVILDPFPERPHVMPERLAQQGDRVRRLSARGYDVACEDDNTIACERTLPRAAVDRELRTVRRLLGSPP